MLVVVVVKVALAALDLGNARRAAKVRRPQRTSSTAGGGRHWATGREGPKEKPTTRTSPLSDGRLVARRGSPKEVRKEKAC